MGPSTYVHISSGKNIKNTLRVLSIKRSTVALQLVSKPQEKSNTSTHKKNATTKSDSRPQQHQSTKQNSLILRREHTAALFLAALLSNYQKIQKTCRPTQNPGI